jgi:oxygen-independent coproporphyrinogen-3 oxidase
MSSTIVQSPAAGARLRLAALPPLALYVHLPWCVRKCPYCDFNSHEARGALPEDEYVDALIADLESTLPSVWGRRVHSIFFGGGTPSLFSARSVDRLLSAIRARLPLDPDAEITLEANPGTFESDKFRDFRAAGVNRLSIGIQSFNPKHLAALGRIHDEHEAHRRWRSRTQLRELQPRLDVCAAGADRGRGGS